MIAPFVVLVFVSGCASLPEKNTTQNSVARSEADSTAHFPVIDAHTHAWFDGKPFPDSGIPNTLEGYLASRDRAGVIASVSHSARVHPAPFQDLSKYNVIQCYGLGDKIDYHDLESELKNGHYRCIKVYLGYIHRWAYDEAYRKTYRLAEKYKVPVVFHTGDTYVKNGKAKFADPLTIDEVAVDFPKVTFVIAHMGNPWIESAAEVAYKNENVYIEGSAFLIGKLDEESPEKLEEYVVKPIRWVYGYIENPKKVMFGTDWPHTDIQPYLELYKKAIPRKDWCDVFFNNANRVFGFNLKETCDLK